jgi:hypothetical protein
MTVLTAGQSLWPRASCRATLPECQAYDVDAACFGKFSEPAGATMTPSQCAVIEKLDRRATLASTEDRIFDELTYCQSGGRLSS